MLFSLVKTLLRPRPRERNGGAGSSAAVPVRLHIGGQTPHSGWQIVDVRPGAYVDHVASCTNLSKFRDGEVSEIYASHVIEHLGYQSELPAALREFHRVLVTRGVLYLSVPDLAVLCELFLDPALSHDERFHVMRMMFGGQVNQADFHHVGLCEEFLAFYLSKAGFIDLARVENFGLFDDASNVIFKGRAISLNVRAYKPRQA